MILLDTTTKSLEVVLGAGVVTQLPIVANWVDLNTGVVPTVSGVSDITLATNNTTAVTAVAAPLGSTTRQVKFLSVRNSNAAAVTVKVQLNNNGTVRVIVAASLSQDETLTYLDGVGVSVMNWNGEHKESAILINLTSQVTGTLPVANGGTGDTTLAAHGVLIGNGTSAVAVITPDASTTKVLTSGGASADPTWATVTADLSTATGTLAVTHGGTGVTTLTTAYALIAAGTTATGNVQTLSTGTTGYTLVSGGASALPTYVATGAPIVAALSDGATPALDASLGTVFTLAAAGDRTIAVPTNATNGQKIVIRHLASGGARTLALNSGAGGFRFGSDITSLSQTASGKTDYIGCIYSSIDSKWDVIAVTKGF